MNEPPKIIYLQLNEFPDTTWCQDKINDDDPMYILADHVEKLLNAHKELYQAIAPLSEALPTS